MTLAEPLNRIDLKEFVGDKRTMRYYIFKDANAKSREFNNIDFSYCIFERCYFHKAKITNCKFVGTTFIDCNFRSIHMSGCDFTYAAFTNSSMPMKEILSNLPSWPNAKRELLQNLRRNANSLGDYAAEKTFIIEEIKARKEHYRNGWLSKDLYYSNKYNTFLKRSGQLFRLYLLRLDNFVWGHGEKPLKSVISVTVGLFFLGALVSHTEDRAPVSLSIADFIRAYISTFLECLRLFLDLEAAASPLPWYAQGIIAVARYLFIGLVAAALYRKIAHR